MSKKKEIETPTEEVEENEEGEKKTKVWGDPLVEFS